MAGGLTDDPLLYDHDAPVEGGKPRMRTTSKIEGSVSGSFSPGGLTIGGQVTEISLTASAWVKMERSGTTTPAGSGPLTDRNNITVQNISDNGGVVLWAYSASTPSTLGFRISDGGFKSVALTDAIDVYCRMQSGTGKIGLDEVA